ncbi:peptidase U32 family protein, partial [Elusimicrobiota bacterium]
MKILTPFDTVGEVKKLIDAGADELYCGVNDTFWRKKGVYSNARQMSYGNLSSFEELNKALSIAKSRGVPVFLCANGYLTKGPYEHLVEDINRAIDCGINGVIVADITLVSLIKKKSDGCKVIMSCLNPCFSKKGIDFYRSLGVDRMIFTLNQLSLDELQDLSSCAHEMGLETEIFINNIACRNMPGNCLYNSIGIFNQTYKKNKNAAVSVVRSLIKSLPFGVKNRLSRSLFSSRLHPSPCRRESSIEVFSAVDKSTADSINSYSPDKEFAQNFCRLCSIYLLNKLKITSGKIAGRGYPEGRKIKDTKFAKEYLKMIVNEQVGGADYVSAGMRLYARVYGIS